MIRSFVTYTHNTERYKGDTKLLIVVYSLWFFFNLSSTCVALRGLGLCNLVGKRGSTSAIEFAQQNTVFTRG